VSKPAWGKVALVTLNINEWSGTGPLGEDGLKPDQDVRYNPSGLSFCLPWRRGFACTCMPVLALTYSKKFIGQTFLSFFFRRRRNERLDSNSINVTLTQN
jgi:hypothetical protein